MWLFDEKPVLDIHTGMHVKTKMAQRLTTAIDGAPA